MGFCLFSLPQIVVSHQPFPAAVSVWPSVRTTASTVGYHHLPVVKYMQYIYQNISVRLKSLLFKLVFVLDTHTHTHTHTHSHIYELSPQTKTRPDDGN